MSTSTANVPLGETIAPADQAAVAEAVRSAGGQGSAVYPHGGGTRLDYGVRPQRPGIALSLAKLNRVVDYPAADLTITVEAGTTIADLTKLLASQRQRLPIDIPQPDRATVGGAVAVNAAGPRRYAYGTMHDYLLGFTAVDGVGGMFSGGGRVVKNAAGYNMCRLMAGSLGTLGVLTQATLMVRPLAEASALAVCDVADFKIAEKLLASLIQSPTRPVAIDFVAGQPPANETVLGPMSAGAVGRLYVGFEGAAAEVDWMVEQLRQEWAAAGATAPMLVPAAHTEPLWRWLADFAADVQINVLPSAVVPTMAKILPLDPELRDPGPRRRWRDTCKSPSPLEKWAIGGILRRPPGRSVAADRHGGGREDDRAGASRRRRSDCGRRMGTARPGDPRHASHQRSFRSAEHPQSGAIHLLTKVLVAIEQ